MKLRTFFSGLWMMAALVAIGLVVARGLPGGWMSQEWIDRVVRGRGLSGEFLFVGVAGLATALAVPRQVVSFLGGYAFGAGLGAGLALAGTELGCVLAFFHARVIGRPLVGRRLTSRIAKVERLLAADPFRATVMARLLPAGSNFAISVLAGITRVRARPFLLGSLVGYIPQTLVFALAGSGVVVGGGVKIGIAVVLFAVSGFIGIRIYRDYGRSFAGVDGEIERLERKAAAAEAPQECQGPVA